MFDAFTSLDEKLNESTDNRTLWFIKTDFDAALDPSIVKLVQAGAKDAIQKRDASKQKLSAIANKKLVWVGAMLRDSKGKLEAWVYRDDVPDGDVCTIAPIPNDKDKGQIVAVGSIRNKQLTFQNSPETALAGRPLFWFRLDQPNKN